MKKPLRYLLCAVAALIAVLPCAVAPAFANSGPREEQGVTASGVTVSGENSALAVENEKLTFDIPDFPSHYYASDEEQNEKLPYNSKVTAEYTFKNTSDATVRTEMAFPMGTVPYSYDYYYGNETPFEPTITVNGERVETQIRHTVDVYDNFDDSVAKISDEWYSDSFINCDLPVTAYRVYVDRGNYSDIRATVEFTGDESKTRVICNAYGDKARYFFYETSTPYEELVERQYMIYVLGDAENLQMHWTVEREYYRFGRYTTKRVDLPVEVVKMENKDGTPLYTDLKSLILSKRQAESVVSDLDYYNGVVKDITRGGIVAGDIDYLSVSDSRFCIWYLYETEAAPGASFVNTVTVPLFPNIQYGYDPYVYEYQYYLSPAKKWAGFGSLEVEIKTEHYAMDPPDSFIKTDYGYHVSYEQLPEGELTFRLCSAENPEYRRTGTAIGWWLVIIFIVIGFGLTASVLIGGLVFTVVYLVKSKKNRT